MRIYIIIAFLIFILAAAGWLYTQQFPNHLQTLVAEKANLEQLKEPDRRVIAPPPLRGPIEETSFDLTAEGVFSETNRHRQENNLPILTRNSELDLMAQIKAEDMFEKQYFAHESPTGQGPADLADLAGYDYVVVGENLAMGNFESDEALVQAWMDSPGHRENILSASFSEIGIAVMEGSFEDQSVWMAVQSFGRPAADCPEPDKALIAKIEQNEEKLDSLNQEIAEKEEEIEQMQPKRGPAYRQAVNEYNALVREYNSVLEETEDLVKDYNRQVTEYNECVHN